MTATTPEPSLRPKLPFFRWLARAAAISALGLASYILLAPGDTASCSTVNTITTGESSGDSGTSEEIVTCTPVRPSLNDVVPLLAIALLLVVGEFSEVAVPGMLSLKRDLTTQSLALAQQDKRQDELEKSLVEVRMAAEQSQSVSVNTVFDLDRYQSPQVVRQQVEEKMRAEDDEEHYVDAADDQRLLPLKYEILKSYERLSPYVAMGAASAPELLRGRYPGIGRIVEELGPAQIESVREWFRRYGREIKSVRAVRNAIAHPPDLVAEDDLQDTLATISDLTDELARLDLPV